MHTSIILKLFVILLSIGLSDISPDHHRGKRFAKPSEVKPVPKIPAPVSPRSRTRHQRATGSRAAIESKLNPEMEVVTKVKDALLMSGPSVLSECVTTKLSPPTELAPKPPKAQVSDKPSKPQHSTSVNPGSVSQSPSSLQKDSIQQRLKCRSKSPIYEMSPQHTPSRSSKVLSTPHQVPLPQPQQSISSSETLSKQSTIVSTSPASSSGDLSSAPGTQQSSSPSPYYSLPNFDENFATLSDPTVTGSQSETATSSVRSSSFSSSSSSCPPSRQMSSCSSDSVLLPQSTSEPGPPLPPKGASAGPAPKRPSVSKQ